MERLERLRASPHQFLALLEFMERHGDLSKLNRLKSDRLWQALVIILNSIDAGVVKSLDKWKKVWADWKAKTKKKYLLRHLGSNGAPGNDGAQLSALEQRVIEILKLAVANEKLGPNSSQTSVVQDNENEILYILEEVPEDNGSMVHSPSPHPESPGTPELMPSPMASNPLPSPPPPPPSSPPRYTQQSPGFKDRRLQSLRARRRLRHTTFSTSEFVAVEKRRLELEEARDKRLHEREMERLRLESQRIEVTREHNQLLQRLGDIAQKFLSTFTQSQPSPPVPSTDMSIIAERLIEALNQTRSSAPVVQSPLTHVINVKTESE